MKYTFYFISDYYKHRLGKEQLTDAAYNKRLKLLNKYMKDKLQNMKKAKKNKDKKNETVEEI
jgi:hypothetical protein